jgi:hypothetical protein
MSSLVRSGSRKLATLFLLLVPNACVTTHVIGGFANGGGISIQSTADAEGCLVLGGAVIGTALAIDIVTFPVQYALDYYPYGPKYRPMRTAPKGPDPRVLRWDWDAWRP